MKSLTKKLLVIVAALATIGLAAGCGSDDNANNGTTIQPGNNGNDDADLSDAADAGDVFPADAADIGDATDTNGDAGLDGQSDTDGMDGGNPDGGDADADGGGDAGDATQACSDTVSCPDGKICLDGSCVTETADAKCQAAEDLGTLQLNSPVSVNDTLFDQSDKLITACGPASGGEKVYKFTVAEDSEVAFDAHWNGQFDGVVAFRKNACVASTTATDPCFDMEQESFIAEAGNEYYMIVEHATGRANDFEVTLEAGAIQCVPGETSCNAGTLERCVGDGTSQAFGCAADCAPTTVRGAACMGNLCEQAIEVTAPTSFAGDINAYSSEYDFGQIAGCDAQGTTVGTPGADIVFKLPGLTAGEQVTIDAATNDSNNNAIFITSNCTRPVDLTCVEGFFSNENPTWTVPAGGGDFYVFIDKASNTGSAFNYSIDIQ